MPTLADLSSPAVHTVMSHHVENANIPLPWSEQDTPDTNSRETSTTERSNGEWEIANLRPHHIAKERDRAVIRNGDR